MLSPMEFFGLEFRSPWLLLLCLVAPLVYWLASQLPSRAKYSSLQLLDVGPTSLKIRLSFLPALLLAAATLFLGIALAGPRTGDATTEVYREGITIMLVMDHSGSMDARDFVANDTSVSRLDALKTVLRNFVLGEGDTRGRPDDLIGVVAFGTFADGICPLTLDHGNLVSIIEDVTVARSQAEGATAIGDGLALAVERMRTHKAKSKVVVLVTDGVNNAGEVDPLQAADLAAAHDIRVYTIAAGRTGRAPIPVKRRDGRTVLRSMRVEIDEATLREIAKRTDGQYFHAEDADGLQRTYAAIDALERSEITEVRYLQYHEHFPKLVLSALVLMALAALLAGTWLRRLP